MLTIFYILENVNKKIEQVFEKESAEPTRDRAVDAGANRCNKQALP